MDVSTGVPAVDAVLVWGGALTLFVGVGGALWRVVRAVSQVTRRAGHFLDDWYGEGARPGVVARPGVMERLGTLEEGLRSVHHEVTPNSGRSLRDAVDRANERLEQLCPGPIDCPPPDEPPEEPPGEPATPPQGH
ncbi:hypothetical protein ACFYSF_22190 [Streptomyces canus]|uniref:hypothetical protein n=1 Tax=Streptomyces canus TaxID=58343 RepID=UPI0036C8A426